MKSKRKSAKTGQASQTDLAVGKVNHLTRKSIATRARLVATAERMFAARGIEGASLSDINLAAGQRNKNATHYYFGDKNGLLQAIFDKHVPGIVSRRDRLLDELEAHGGVTPIGVVRALLYPLAEKLFDADGGPEFIRINAQLAASLAAMLNNSGRDLLRIGPLDRLQAARTKILSHLPEPVAQHRVTLATSLILNGLADHSRALETSSGDKAAETELFIRNLEDCLVALCNAPVSASVAGMLNKSGPNATASLKTTSRRSSK